MKMLDNQNKILAFVHIEKAAGQTIGRILESNFPLTHCRVAPLKKEHLRVFTAEDMKIIKRLNPYVKSISGHSIKPYNDLIDIFPNIRFITILRDPVERYISHYQYWVQKLKKNITFENFLKLDKMKNFQVKKIAGEANIRNAISILNEKFFLVGTVEEFDSFLYMLKFLLKPIKFECNYKIKNFAIKNCIKNYIKNNRDKYEKKIVENNLLDIELYNFVKYVHFPKIRKEMPINLRESQLKSRNINTQKTSKLLINRVYRYLYFDLIINIIRFTNGLKVGGSY